MPPRTMGAAIAAPSWYFSDHRNMVVAGASLIAATGLGVKGVTVAGTNLAGIALGTVLALVINLAFRISPRGAGE